MKVANKRCPGGHKRVKKDSWRVWDPSLEASGQKWEQKPWAQGQGWDQTVGRRIWFGRGTLWRGWRCWGS